MNTFGQKLVWLLWFILAKIRYSHYILCFYTLSVLQQERHWWSPWSHLSPSQPATMSSSPLGNHHKIMQLSEVYLLLDKYEYISTIYWSCETKLYSNFHLSFPHPTYDINRDLKRWGAMKHGPVIKHPQLQCVHSVEPGPPRRGAAANDPEVRLVRT